MLCMTLELDLEVRQGETFQYVIGLTGGPATGSLAGFAARMQIRPFKTSGDVLADWTSTSGSPQLTIDDINKLIIFKVPDEETSALSFKKGVYDLELAGNGDVWRVAEGAAILNWEVTR